MRWTVLGCEIAAAALLLDIVPNLLGVMSISIAGALLLLAVFVASVLAVPASFVLSIVLLCRRQKETIDVVIATVGIIISLCAIIGIIISLCAIIGIIISLCGFHVV